MIPAQLKALGLNLEGGQGSRGRIKEVLRDGELEKGKVKNGEDDGQCENTGVSSSSTSLVNK